MQYSIYYLVYYVVFFKFPLSFTLMNECINEQSNNYIRNNIGFGEYIFRKMFKLKNACHKEMAESSITLY